MKAPQTILVATDFSPLADVGVDVAVVLARRMGAKLHVVHVLEPVASLYPYPFTATNLEAIEVKRRADAIAKLETIRARGVAVTREVGVGIPSRELVVAAQNAKADLIVIASRGYGLLGRAVLGSVAASLIRMSAVPVLVVGDDRRKTEFDVVVAAVDLSPISREVLDLARTYVVPNGSVEVVTFVEHPIVMTDDLLPYYPTQADRDRLIADRVASVRALIPNDGGPEVRIDAIAKAPPALGILESAEILGADLVVVGTSGHNAWHRAFIGSTATRVLAQAKCPVLVVPTQPHRE